jgi:hypothetical protein
VGEVLFSLASVKRGPLLFVHLKVDAVVKWRLFMRVHLVELGSQASNSSYFQFGSPVRPSAPARAVLKKKLHGGALS